MIIKNIIREKDVLAMIRQYYKDPEKTWAKAKATLKNAGHKPKSPEQYTDKEEVKKRVEKST